MNRGVVRPVVLWGKYHARPAIRGGKAWRVAALPGRVRDAAGVRGGDLCTARRGFPSQEGKVTLVVRRFDGAGAVVYTV